MNYADIGAVKTLGRDIGAIEAEDLVSPTKTFTVDGFLVYRYTKIYTIDAQLICQHIKAITIDVILVSGKEWLANQPTLDTVELYEVTLANGVIYYYTSHDQDIWWGLPAILYTAIPVTRGPIRKRTNLEAQTCEISLGNISGDLFDLLHNNILEAATITIKRVFFKEAYRDDLEVTLFIGFASPSFDRTQLLVELRSVTDSLQIKVPRRCYKEACNSALFDDECNLIRADHVYTGEATSDGEDGYTLIDIDLPVRRVDFDGSAGVIAIGEHILGGTGAGTAHVVNIVYLTATTGTIWYTELVLPDFINNEVLSHGAHTVVANGTPAEDRTFYERGELEMLTGNNSGQRRMIRAADDDTICLSYALPYCIVTGDTYKLYPGCQKTPEACYEKFNNKASFSGFLHVPKVEETIM